MKKLLSLMCLLALSHLPCHAQINWGAPTAISSSGVDATDPRIVTDSDGNSTAIWIESGIIKASTIPSGGSWGAIATLSNISNTSSEPRLKIDGSGNVTAVWLENGIVNVATLPAGGSWSAETALSNEGGGASDPALSVDSAGNTAVVWTRGGFIESTQYPVIVGSWSLVSQLSSNGAENHPDIYIGEGGTIVAVYHSIVSGSDYVYSSRGTVNGAWGSPVNMLAAAPGAHHDYPKVAVDTSGNANSIWFRFMDSGTTYSQVVVLASSLSSTTSTWTAIPTQLSLPGMFNPANLNIKIGVDSNGDVLALWTISYNGYTFSVESAVLPQGGSWQTPGELVIDNTYAFKGDISITTLGSAVVNFMYYDETDINIQSVETSINGLVQNYFSIPVNISTGTGNDFPRVSAQYQSSSGTIFGGAVWVNFDGSNNVIAASVGSDSVVAPPTNVSVSQGSTNFGVFTEYYNTITWTASTDPDLFQYIIYRNGVAFKTVTPSNTSFVDHNAVQNQDVTYGVAAVNNSEILSPIVTFNLTFP